MQTEYRIISYTHPLKPELTMYKCMIGGDGIHSQHLCVVNEWRTDQIKNKFKHSKIAELNFNATVSFFENSNISKD
jgi:hypothetical protein